MFEKNTAFSEKSELTDDREITQSKYDLYSLNQSLNYADVRKFPPGYLEQSRVPQIVAGNAAVQALGCLVFFARVYSRVILSGIWKSEDWALLVAWVGPFMRLFVVDC